MLYTFEVQSSYQILTLITILQAAYMRWRFEAEMERNVINKMEELRKDGKI